MNKATLKAVRLDAYVMIPAALHPERLRASVSLSRTKTWQSRFFAGFSLFPAQTNSPLVPEDGNCSTVITKRDGPTQ